MHFANNEMSYVNVQNMRNKLIFHPCALQVDGKQQQQQQQQTATEQT